MSGSAGGRPLAGTTRVETPWIHQFLAYGFVPELPAGQDPLVLLREWSRPRRRRDDEVTEADLVREGVRALRAAFESVAEEAVAGDQVVFLSGGLDSRTILGGLLDMYSTTEVVAATFGRPGESDFDYASRVARVAGVRHERLESFTVEWSTDALVQSVLARDVPLPYPFGQRYLSWLLHRRLGTGNVFWDGLSGDTVSGNRAPGEGAASTWDAALAGFKELHLLPRWRELTGPDFDPDAVLPPTPFCDPDLLSYADQLNFALRQARKTGTRMLRGYAVKTPFLSGPWLDFMLSVPPRYRIRQHLYTEIQKAAFPRLFSLPLTTFRGGALIESRRARARHELERRVRRRLAGTRLAALLPGKPAGANDAIRTHYLVDGDIREVVRENLADLDARGLVAMTDLPALVRSDAAAGDAAVVTVLLGLELNLKAVERRAGGTTA